MSIRRHQEPTLGTWKTAGEEYLDNGSSVELKLDQLLKSRLLIQANSGAGKSWALRRILEETNGRVPHLVIDVEDEFHTLRESFPYVMAAPTGGDVLLNTKTAPLLVKRILEHRFSTILNLSDFAPYQRLDVVRVVLESLLAAPRALWGQLLVVVDEAHIFCPQHGSAESADAVMALMTRGRKRGFCGVLATQRISKLHKDAAAECNTKLIGRAALDIDMQRAGDELGMTKEGRQQLRTLKPGEFFSFGPALSTTVELLMVGPVKTTHPEPGARGSGKAPPAPAALREVLATLAELPKEAAEEAQTVETLKAEVKRLNGELRISKAKEGKPAADPYAIAAAREDERKKLSNQYTGVILGVQKQNKRVRDLVAEVLGVLKDPSAEFAMSSTPIRLNQDDAPKFLAAERAYRGVKKQPSATYADVVFGLGDGPRKILNVAAQYDQVDMTQVAVLTGYKRSTRAEYVKRLVAAGFVTKEQDRIKITEAGLDALGTVEELPTGPDLQDYWRTRLPDGEWKVLYCAIDHHPKDIQKSLIEERCNFARSTTAEYIKRLVARKLLVPGRGTVRASDNLF